MRTRPEEKLLHAPNGGYFVRIGWQPYLHKDDVQVLTYRPTHHVLFAFDAEWHPAHGKNKEIDTQASLSRVHFCPLVE